MMSQHSGHKVSTIDGALDTLGCVVRVMGEESFPLEEDDDSTLFDAHCRLFAAHIENGAAVPGFDIEHSIDGERSWAAIRRFFADRRRAEKTFVTDRLQNYREVIMDLVAGLRRIGERDNDTEQLVKLSFADVETAVKRGKIDEIETALNRAIDQVGQTFAEQKRDYDSRLGALQDRLNNMRQDLVAAREEMKRDPLTNAYNRGAFDTAIKQSMSLHFALNQPVTVIMIDLDNFKQVNDTHGHSAGDAVLRAVSGCLERVFIRKGDVVCRFGGDEFAVVLNDTDPKDAARLTERCIDGVRAIELPDFELTTTLGCSIGYTEIHVHDDAASLIARADKALYQAKSLGRGCAVYRSYEEDQRDATA
ncbi:MAG: diguanylate cyclase [Pseudomonadota bacterium]